MRKSIKYNYKILKWIDPIAKSHRNSLRKSNNKQPIKKNTMTKSSKKSRLTKNLFRTLKNKTNKETTGLNKDKPF